MLVSKYADHVWPVAYEVLPAQLARRQQKHDSFVEEGEADALFIFKVVDVFLKLAFVRVTLWHECDHALTFKFLDILKVGAQGHI